MNVIQRRDVSSKLPFMTIRTRLTLWYSSLLATVIIVFGISLFSILNWSWRSQVRDTMVFIAQQTLTDISRDPASGKIDMQNPDILDLISTYPFAIQVRDADGKLLRASSSLAFTDPFDRAGLAATEAVTRDVLLGKAHAHALVFTVPIVSETNQHLGTVQILYPLTTMEQATD